MSINYCTISNSSIDSFCGNRRQIVLQRLIAEFRPPVVNPGRNSGAGVGRWPQRPEEKYVPPYVPTELERIRVEVKLGDYSGTAAQDIKFQTELVVITNLQSTETGVGVNISNLRLK